MNSTGKLSEQYISTNLWSQQISFQNTIDQLLISTGKLSQHYWPTYDLHR